jgi:hypothetical protein
MLSRTEYFQSEAERLVKDEVERRKTNLVTAHNNIDHAEYKFRVGEIRGLLMALDLLEEAAKKAAES